MPYSIEEHRHRFAAWAAGRAATVNGCRFKVEQGKEIIELSGINEIGKDINNLPSTEEFDNSHREWRNLVIQAAQRFQPSFTHGVAAKLINIYFKSIFVCGGQHYDLRIKAIHPPIDSVLLDDLYNRNVGGLRYEWQAARRRRWSKLSSDEYEHLIECIKKVIPQGSGLWTIEEYWQGYQSNNTKSSSSMTQIPLSANPAIGKVSNSNLYKNKKRMPNADKLWKVVQNKWPLNSKWLTIREIKSLAPIGTEGIDNRSSYDFAMLTMFSTIRREYLVHENSITEKVINEEVVKTNRNNGIWRNQNHLNSRVQKA